jgi:hypothetical protein
VAKGRTRDDIHAGGGTRDREAPAFSSPCPYPWQVAQSLAKLLVLLLVLAAALSVAFGLMSLLVSIAPSDPCSSGRSCGGTSRWLLVTIGVTGLALGAGLGLTARSLHRRAASRKRLPIRAAGRNARRVL